MLLLEQFHTIAREESHLYVYDTTKKETDLLEVKEIVTGP